MTWSETGSLDKSLDELWNLSIGKFSDVKHAVEFTAFLESKISEQLLESAKADPKLALKIISMPKYGAFITPSVKGQVEVRIKEMVDQSNQLRDLAESMRVKKELFESKFMIIKNTGGYDAMGKPVITKSYPYGEMVYSKVLLIVDSLEASFKTAPSFELSVHQANAVIEVYEKMLSFSDDELKSISKELKKVNDIKAIRGVLKL
jgi:topoisomerase IA-like protein